MGVTIVTKNQVVTDEGGLLQHTLLKKRVDELGALTEQADKLREELEANPIFGKIDKITVELEEYLRGQVDDTDEDNEQGEIELKGDVYKMVLSAPRKAREIFDKALMMTKLKKFGSDVLIQLVKVNLTDLDKYFSKIEQEEFVKETKGARSCKLKPLK